MNTLETLRRVISTMSKEEITKLENLFKENRSVTLFIKQIRLANVIKSNREHVRSFMACSSRRDSIVSYL